MSLNFKPSDVVYALYMGIWQQATVISIDGKVAEITLSNNKVVKENVFLELGNFKSNKFFNCHQSDDCDQYLFIRFF